MHLSWASLLPPPLSQDSSPTVFLIAGMVGKSGGSRDSLITMWAEQGGLCLLSTVAHPWK